MQFDPDNVKALCLGCHLYWWHKHPIEAKEWAQNTLGKARLNRLKKRSNIIDKTFWDYHYIKNDLQKKLEDLKNGKRAND